MKPNYLPMPLVLAALLACFWLNPTPAAAMDGSLIHRFSFTTNANDNVGHADGALMNGASIVNGRVLLNGTTNYVNLPPKLLDGLTSVTIEFWATFGVNGNWSRVFDFGDQLANGNGRDYIFFTPHSSYLDHRMVLKDAISEDVNATAGVLDGLSLHVACVFDPPNGIMILYTNGVAESTNALTRSLRAVLNNYSWLGRSLWTSDAYLNGSIDEFRIYRTALSSAQVAASFVAGPDAPASSAPVLVNQLQDQTVVAGSAPSFNVSAGGAVPLGYQWFFNGTNIDRATNATLALTNVQPADAGSYAVVVTNAYGAVTSTPPAQLTVLTGLVYFADFEGAVGPEWSNKTISVTPTGYRHFLGEFGSQTATLTLTNMPVHTVVSVEFDLYILRSMDGNSTGYGPDYWSMQVKNGPLLLRTTFGNKHPYSVASGQAYPGAYPAVFPDQFGAVETNSLGYPFADSACSFGSMDAVYHLRFEFEHTNANLALDFAGSGLGSLTDESWGLDNVRVGVVSNAAGLIQFTQPSAYVWEDGGSLPLTVQRIGGSDGTVSVNFTTLDGTTLAGNNYTATNGTLTFGPGETNKTFSVPILSHAEPSGDTWFSLALTNLVGAALLGDNARIPVSIIALPTIQFAQSNYYVSEAEGSVGLVVSRAGNLNRTSTNAIQTGALTAVAGTDYLDINGKDTFTTNTASVTSTITINDNTNLDGQRSFLVSLTNVAGARLGLRTNTTVFILDNDTPAGPGSSLSAGVRDVLVQPDGKILLAGGFKYASGIRQESVVRLNADGSVDSPFNYGMAFNNWAEAIALQPDGRVLVGGDFTTVYGLSRLRIVRLQSGGGLDPGFSATIGPDNSVYRVVLQPADNKIIIGGRFNNINTSPRSKVARLNTDGTLDASFVPPTFAGANGNIFGVAALTNGGVVCGGSFTTVGGSAYPYLARLNSDGSLDSSFNQGGAGPNSTVNSVTELPGGKLLIVGDFTTYNGTARNRIARIYSNGVLDTTFTPGSGADSTIQRRVGVMADGRFVICGNFQTYNGVARCRVARLNANGTLDTTFVLPGGADASAYAVASLADGRIVVGGDFTVFDGEVCYRYAILNTNGSLPASPVNWTQWRAADGGNDHWFALTAKPESWTAAESEALSWNGHLASSTSAAKDAFLKTNFLREVNMLRPFWLGFSDAAVEGTYVWSSGEPVRYTNWNPSEPNNSGGNEDYGTINWYFSGNATTDGQDIGTWNDTALMGTTGSVRADGPYCGIMETAFNPQGITITAQPQDQAVPAGGSVSFTVGAVGVQPLTYQWAFNATNIAGATNATLTLTNLQYGDAGTYSVGMTNLYAGVASSNAALTVLQMPARLSPTVTTTTNGGLGLSLSGLFGHGPVLIYASTNLVTWEPIFTNPPLIGALYITVPPPTNTACRFYRAIEQ